MERAALLALLSEAWVRWVVLAVFRPEVWALEAWVLEVWALEAWAPGAWAPEAWALRLEVVLLLLYRGL